jgi:hypothetical protein
MPMINLNLSNTHPQSTPIPNHSDSNNRVVIIEAVADPDSPGTCPLCKFFSNDIATSTALAKSPFGQVGISHFS